MYYLVSVKFKLNVCSLRLVSLSNRYYTFCRFALTEYITYITCHIFVLIYLHSFDIRIIIIVTTLHFNALRSLM